ncbi:MAG: aldehyde dehydrogenase family protein [Aquitalea sp.]|nr:aldehyde dehydrogenase family protein [Aquitalea sp.]
MGAGYGSAGEGCMAISVAVADAAAEMGPLLTRQHRDKVKGCVDQGVAEGATLLLNGRSYQHSGLENGFLPGTACLITSHRSDPLQGRDFRAGIIGGAGSGF